MAMQKAIDKKLLQSLLSNIVPEEGGKAIPFVTIDDKTGLFQVDP